MSSTRNGRPTVLCAGVYILDILGRPIESIPTTQHSRIIDEIRLTAAGTAGGTAVDLAGLGLEVSACGMVGEDEAGRMLTALLTGAGVDIGLMRRTAKVQTACTMLAIRPDGARPAWHVVGANAELTAQHLPWDRLANFDAVHAGGLNALPGLDGPDLARFLRSAKEAGCLTTADCLGVKRSDALDLLRLYLPHVDVFLPNDLEALAISGCTDVPSAARLFRSLGAQNVVVTTGESGCWIDHPGGTASVPAHRVDVADTTGCGDALTAGVIAAMLAGQGIVAAAEYGTAAAALTAMALGSDGGRLSPDRVAAQLATAEHRRVEDASAPGAKPR